MKEIQGKINNQDLNVHNMKFKIIAILMFFTSSFVKANQRDSSVLFKREQQKTKYFIVDSKSPDYKINLVELNAKKLYGIDKNIELYNVLIDKNILVLFSVLPVKEKDSWSEISLDKLNNVVGAEGLKKILDQGFQAYQKSELQNSDGLKRDDIKVVINRNGTYFISNYCLTEFFKIVTQELIFPNEMGNVFINIKSPMFSVSEYESKYKHIYNEYSANALTSARATGSSSLKHPLERPLNFLSAKTPVGNYTAYKFWQFSDWRVADGTNSRRGIDRFLYIPEIGIVGGSFDFWFSQLGISGNEIMKNYLSEDVILPISINEIDMKLIK